MEREDDLLKEVKRIRMLLEPPPPEPPPENFVEEFKRFLSKYRVLGLAVAFILGVYLGQLIQSLVSNLIMPIVEIALPEVQWQEISFGPFGIGAFVGDLITFIIIAFLVFVIIKMANRVGIK
ncbi:MAG: MscL family protein [Candidatus Thorarchaeota archaeon]